MDRELKVVKDNTVYAELKFKYDRANAGTVHVTVNSVYDMGDDMKSSYPTYQGEQYFNHGTFTSIDQFKSFDVNFLKQLPDGKEAAEGDKEFVYEPLSYRYAVSHRDVIGVAEVKINFLENQKEFSFISLRRLKEDYNGTSNSFETNKTMLDNFFQNEWMQVYGTEYKLVEWN